ncbi:efflux transporter outer membrane subunit [Sphingomonas oryzagri]
MCLRAGCWGGFLLLGACSLAPPYHRPTPPVANNFPASAEGGASIAGIGWREFFSDPDLQRLIETALANNRDVRVAVGRVAEARAQYRIEGSALYPSVDGVVSMVRSRTPADLSLIGQPLLGNQFQSALSLGWEVDLWGRLRNMRASALENFLATGEARRGVETSLVAQLVTTWLQAHEYDERIALAERTIASRTESYRIARRRYEVGSGSKLDMTQAETLLTQAQTSVQALLQARDETRDALTLLVGAPYDPGTRSLHLADTGFDRALPTGLPSDLLLNRPDILAAEHQLIAAHADIGAARANFFPTITLTGDFGTASAHLDDLFARGQRSWSFSPSVTLPIFDAGRNKANLDLAKARRDIAVANYEKTVQAAFRDVADALAQRKWLAGQISTTQATLDALDERLRLAQLRYTSGRSAYLEVLEAERDRFDTEQALVQLRRAYFESVVNLYAALGGGFPEQPAIQAPNGQAR